MGYEAKRDSLRYVSNKVHTVSERLKKVNDRLSEKIRRLRELFRNLVTQFDELREVQLSQSNRLAKVEYTLTGEHYPSELPNVSEGDQ